ncbi:probable receptor-like protein kinase At2g42960 [Olea europaea var. sylvestris]|uniref:probable receptor-like protein kinase At2g42960 n=1 Tax=Olea europaea var. sylvestris TaxID=158386 RepID=UPI000C1D804D|nr:probable receptor-like protein kinase At2g42960 [Olea europaea var. sylvestris]XP_022848690.1 probable receptor-like protein kinase At2g42960 [Olea europaea var. sylvestris]XP_022848691.1 probable receptor-like protein kinase At2g42960 [Olea europaea var. sylvestris]
MSSGNLKTELSKEYGGVKLWVLICICMGAFIVLILGILSMWVIFRRKSRRTLNKYSLCQIPNVSKDIRVDSVGEQIMHDRTESLILTLNDKSSDKNSEKMLVNMSRSKSSDVDNSSQCSSMFHHERACSFQSGEEGSSGAARKQSTISYGFAMPSPLVGLPEISHLGWGHWFTLRDLEIATNRFSAENILGEGGYGVVYQGRLVNGTDVAVKKLLNNLGQAEKEFGVEVEAIGHVRHKNLVRLLGYCIEGVHRMLVYEYVNNGNLEQWLHGAMRQHGTLTWEARMKVLLGTAKALAYLHEAIEPKVVHRDIKSSNILIDDEFNAKVSDFGLAKLLGSGESHITTRVMGTFGYVAPEYANTGLLNEKSDVYSFGVLLLEAVTGRDPVDYGRPAVEVNLVEWLKMMVGNRRAEEVVDPNLEARPTTRALKRALLVALRCVDPDSQKRPKMSQVVRMLEADEFPYHEDRRTRKSRTSMEIESTKEGRGSSADQESSGVGQSERHISEPNHGYN